jgi:hypothetical protein
VPSRVLDGGNAVRPASPLRSASPAPLRAASPSPQPKRVAPKATADKRRSSRATQE